MSRTFDFVLSDDARVSLPAAHASLTIHPDASDFVGALEEMAGVPGVRFEVNVGDRYAAVDVTFPVFGADLEISVFVPNSLMQEEGESEQWSFNLSRREAEEIVRGLIPEVTS